MAAVPWYVVGLFMVRHVPGISGQNMDFFLEFMCCLSNATFAAGAVAVFFLILVRVGISEARALLATSIFGLATPIFAYSAWFYSEPLTTLLWMAGAYLLFCCELKERSAMLAGVVTGLSVLVRPTNALVLCLFTVGAIAWRGRNELKKAIWFAAGTAIPIAILFIYNASLFGNPLDFGYPAVAENGRKLNSFSTPFYVGLYGFLLSPGKSVFLFSPPLLLGLLGIRKLWKANRGLAFLAMTAPLLYIAFFCTYAQWEGGYSYGPRYLVPSLALFSITIGTALDRRDQLARTLAWATAGAGFVVQCIGIATSFLEAEVSSRGYYEASWNYNLSFSIAEYVRVLFHYLTHPGPAPLGLGFDRWFLFLAKAGVATSTISAIAALITFGMLLSCASLRKSLR